MELPLPLLFTCTCVALWSFQVLAQDVSASRSLRIHLTPVSVLCCALSVHFAS